MHQLLICLMVALGGFMLQPAEAAWAVGTSEDTSDEAEGEETALTEARGAIASENYAAAVPMLVRLVDAHPDWADAWNLLGFSYRKLGQYDQAGAAYDRALALNPDHRGALEYQGELFLKIGQPEKARANLDRLKALCGDCEEAGDLAEALAAAS